MNVYANLCLWLKTLAYKILQINKYMVLDTVLNTTSLSLVPIIHLYIQSFISFLVFSLTLNFNFNSGLFQPVRIMCMFVNVDVIGQ